MQFANRALRPYIGTRAFYKDALTVMVPVVIQQLINNLFNMVDNVMVGGLDIEGLAMSAVNVANKPYLIFFGVFFGVTGAGGLMISQYAGARDAKTCQGLFSLQMLLGMCNAILFSCALFFFPHQIMRLFVTEEQTVALGVLYIRIVCFSYLPVSVSSTCIFALRALGKNKISMRISIITMIINAVLNYVFIFGKLGMPQMGVEGAALGTVLSRLCEMVFYLALLFRKRMIFTTDIFAAFRLPHKVVASFAKKAIPLVVNELFWTVGMSMYFWCYAKVDEAALPAITVSELLFQISAVMVMGTSSAVSVLIGTELGANELQKARDNCKKLFSLVVVISCFCVVACIALGAVLPHAFNISVELRQLSSQLTYTMAFFSPLAFVYGFCFFCLRAGGDTRTAAMMDGGYMWLVPVPACIYMALYLPGKISVFTAVLVVQILMNAKVFVALRVLRKGKWVRNITTIEG